MLPARGDVRGILVELVGLRLGPPPNALTSRITDGMPAILPCNAWPIWQGETGAPLAEVKALLQTYEDRVGWTMAPQQPSRPTKQPNAQGRLF
jgi:hypothetical protein